MSDKYSTICFCEETYKQYYEYTGKREVNEVAMWDDVKDFIRIAVRNGYQMRVRYDGMTVMIDYNYQDGGLADCSLEWLGPEEYVGNFMEDKELLRDKDEL